MPQATPDNRLLGIAAAVAAAALTDICGRAELPVVATRAIGVVGCAAVGAFVATL